jgi:hypothetical protein
MRTSGIDIIGNISCGTHFCQFYQTKEDLMDILIPYLMAWLDNNEFLPLGHITTYGSRRCKRRLEEGYT